MYIAYNFKLFYIYIIFIMLIISTKKWIKSGKMIINYNHIVYMLHFIKSICKIKNIFINQ